MWENKIVKSRVTKHHIIPSSRGGTNDLENITGVSCREHERYHLLFINRTPSEIIEYLVKTFWKDSWEYVKEAQRRYDNGKRDR